MCLLYMNLSNDDWLAVFTAGLEEFIMPFSLISDLNLCPLLSSRVTGCMGSKYDIVGQNQIGQKQ